MGRTAMLQGGVLLVILTAVVHLQAQPLPPSSVFRLYLEPGSGRLILVVHGEEGTVCASGLDRSAAQVICNMLNPRRPTQAMNSGISQEFSGRRVWWRSVTCPLGNETYVLDCYYPVWQPDGCPDGQDAVIRCNAPITPAPTPPPPPTTPPVSSFFNLWLQGGVSAWSGRVVARWYDTVGTICGINFDRRDAQVVCRMLGYTGTVVRILDFRDLGPATGLGDVLLTDLACTGDEQTLLDCPIGGWNPSNCFHNQDIGVECAGGILTPTLTPPPRPTFGSEVVLRGGPDPYHGIVHIRTGNTFATVCSMLFGPREAQVVCRQLRARTQGTVVLDNLYGPGSGLIFLEDFICDGSESNLQECGLAATTMQTCAHTQDVSIGCGPLRDPNGVEYRVFLVGGPTSRHGRLVVEYYGQNGTVCDRNFGLAEAQVACRGVGYTGPGIQVVGNLYGPGMDLVPILLDQVNCTGGERTLADCQSRGWGRHMCDHNMDVSINCGPTPVGPGPGPGPGPGGPIQVSLVGGPDVFHGRVRVVFMGVEGTVCDDFFDDNDAAVVCREVGYRGPADQARFAANYFGFGTGRIYFDDLMCTGTESSLLQCPSRGLGTHNCVHSEDASVLCGPRLNPVQRQRLFLLGGPDRLHGVLHVEYIGRNGTVCDDGFGQTEAYVACRQLGYQGDISQVRVEDSRPYRRSTEPQIWLDQVLCTGREISLTDCFYNDWGVHDCSHEEDVHISCGQITGVRCPAVPQIANGRPGTSNTAVGTQVTYTCNFGFFLSDPTPLVCVMDFGFPSPRWNRAPPQCRSTVPTPVPTPTSEVRREPSGRVLLLLNGRPGTICAEGFTFQSAQVICRMLGQSTLSPTFTSVPRVFGDMTMVWVTNLRCTTGNENTLFECPFVGMGVTCSSNADVAVTCGPSAPVPGPGPFLITKGYNKAPQTCGIRLSNKIFGGTVAVEGMWPWMVALTDSIGNPFCGGALIAPNWVATAAHCTENVLNPNLIRAFMGSNNLRSGRGRSVRVSRITMHPRYNIFSNVNDIALLQLSESVPVTANIRPVCLSASLPDIPGTQCFVAGWGITGPAQPGSDVLITAPLPIVPDSICQRIFSSVWNSANMTCAGVQGGREDVCMGDSGGPLMCRQENTDVYHLYGLVTGGRPCGLLTSTYGMYADVRQQIGWIQRVMASSGP